MDNELMNRDEEFLNLASLIVQLLANIQKTLVGMGLVLQQCHNFQRRHIILLSVVPIPTSSDYSGYFEPIAENAPLASEWIQSRKHCALDCSDCFEPVG